MQIFIHYIANKIILACYLEIQMKFKFNMSLTVNFKLNESISLTILNLYIFILAGIKGCFLILVF